MTTDGSSAEDAWEEAAGTLQGQFGDAAFELRASMDGRSAVRVFARNGGVTTRHVEPPSPAAPWSVRATCGAVTGWLLADRAPADPARARDALQRAVERHAALGLQRLGARRAATGSELLEVLTHRLRTDVSTLQVVAEGALAGAFTDDERPEVAAEVAAVGAEAQRRLSAARDVMTTLAGFGQDRAEPVLDVLAAELAAAGVGVAVGDVAGEQPMARVPGAGWASCARRVAEALAGDPRLGEGAEIVVEPDPEGWRMTVGPPGPALRPGAWTRQTLGELVHAGEVLTAAGGSADAVHLDDNGLRVRLVIPAAPSR